jgi:hypothetical protein
MNETTGTLGGADATAGDGDAWGAARPVGTAGDGDGAAGVAAAGDAEGDGVAEGSADAAAKGSADGVAKGSADAAAVILTADVPDPVLPAGSTVLPRI